MPANKFARTNFYKQNNVDGIVENDLPVNFFNTFEFKRPRQFYTLKREDMNRPDLISLKFFGTVNYWWIILKLNEIEDLFNELTVGKSIQIPALADIEEFYTSTRRKRN